MPDAIELGLLDLINKVRKTTFTPDQFLADCRARARLEEIFQQAYMCNPAPSSAQLVDWSSIERCRSDYEIERVHLEAADILAKFGEFNPATEPARATQITDFLRQSFPDLLAGSPSGIRNTQYAIGSTPHAPSLSHPMGEGRGEGSQTPLRITHHALRLGFDVAASGTGHLAVIYIDILVGIEVWLVALFTARTDDWHFLKTVLFYFLRHQPRVQAAGDENGLGRQICWEAAKLFPSRFLKVNFTARKHDLGFALMNQLATAQKHIPRSQQDIAADYFALRKSFHAGRWVFTEGRNVLNPASHCDIAWAGGLATEANNQKKRTPGARCG
jgi:phage FluMu gp28-like protein